MNCFHREGRQAHSDIFGAAFLRSGISNPFAGVGDDGLASGDIERP